MPSTFCCGHLVLNKDGSLRKLHLQEGGGSRDCEISHIDMGFEEIHDRLRVLFLQENTNRISKLYDFQWKELDTNRYTTFFDYIQKNGLKFKGTILYLCTPAVDNEIAFRVASPEKRKSTTVVEKSNRSIHRIPQVEADSSTSVIVIKSDEQTPRPPAIQNVHVSSYSTYCFDKSLDEIIDYLRNLFHQYHREMIFIQLFEHICILRGLSSSILDRIKQQNHSIQENQRSFFNENLDKIDKLSRTIKAEIELNKMKIQHVDQRLVIEYLFLQFSQNFNTLRDRLSNEKSTTSRPSSSTIYVLDPAPTTSFSSSSSSSSSRHPSTKRTHRKTTENDSANSYSLFKNLLKSLDYFVAALRQRRFHSFSHSMEYIIDEIQYCRSNTKLSDRQSLDKAKQLVTSVDNRLSSRMNDEYHRAAPHQVPEEIESGYKKSLDAIRDLLNSIEYYQTKINHHKRSRSILIEEKPQVRTDHIDNDDQSSEASHSSIGDEVLMEVARDAYEHRPNRYK